MAVRLDDMAKAYIDNLKNQFANYGKQINDLEVARRELERHINDCEASLHESLVSPNMSGKVKEPEGLVKTVENLPDGQTKETIQIPNPFQVKENGSND